MATMPDSVRKQLVATQNETSIERQQSIFNEAWDASTPDQIAALPPGIRNQLDAMLPVEQQTGETGSDNGSQEMKAAAAAMFDAATAWKAAIGSLPKRNALLGRPGDDPKGD